MPLQTIDRGTPGNPSDTFKVGVAFDTCQANDNYLDVNFANVAALRAAPSLNQIAHTAGYTTAGDGGAGEYWLDASDTTSADNGFTVIVAADGGRWKLTIPFSGFYNAKQAGARGNGVTDDTARLQLAISLTNIYIPAGTYRISNHLIIESANRKVVGAGKGITLIYQYGKNLDGFWVRSPNYYTIADYLNGGEISDMTIACVAGFSPMPTRGAGIRVTQLNAHVVQRVSISQFLEGMVYEGGQLSSAKTIFISCNAGTYAGDGSALFHVKQSPINGGASYQRQYTLRVEDIFISATLLRDSCMRVHFADGLNIINGYWGFGKNSNLLFMHSAASDYTGGVNLEGLYLDCVGVGNTKHGIEIRENGVSANYTSIQVGSGVFIGNGDGYGILSDVVNLNLMLTGAKISNFVTGSAVKVIGDATGTAVIMTGVLINNCGETGGEGACELSGLRGLTMSGCMFRDVREHAVRLSGAFLHASITGCVNTSPVSDLIRSATFGVTAGFRCSGNTSALADENMWADEKFTSVTLDFPSIAPMSSATLTTSIAGAEVNDIVLGCISGATNIYSGGAFDILFTYGVTATNTVTVKAYNLSGVAGDLPSLTFRLQLHKRF